eukprot:3517789-Rhodomonas_salina.1
MGHACTRGVSTDLGYACTGRENAHVPLVCTREGGVFPQPAAAMLDPDSGDDNRESGRAEEIRGAGSADDNLISPDDSAEDNRASPRAHGTPRRSRDSEGLSEGLSLLSDHAALDLEGHESPSHVVASPSHVTVSDIAYVHAATPTGEPSRSVVTALAAAFE